MEELLLFQVGTLQLGIDLAYIKSIQSAKPNFSEQADNMRLTQVVDGQEIPLYDLLSIFEKGAALRDPDGEKVISVESQNQSMGLIVDRIKQVVPVDDDQIKTLSPIFREPTLACFPKVLKHDNQLVLLFTPEGLAKIDQQVLESQNYSDIPDAEITSLLMEEGDEQAPEMTELTKSMQPANLEQVEPSDEDASTKNDWMESGAKVDPDHPDFASLDTDTLEIDRLQRDPEVESASVATILTEHAVSTIENEVDSQTSDRSPEPSFGFKQVDKRVRGMLQEDQLAAVVKEITTETIKKANLKDIMNRLFNQAAEDLSFKIKKRNSIKRSQMKAGMVPK